MSQSLLGEDDRCCHTTRLPLTAGRRWSSRSWVIVNVRPVDRSLPNMSALPVRSASYSHTAIAPSILGAPPPAIGVGTGVGGTSATLSILVTKTSDEPPP